MKELLLGCGNRTEKDLSLGNGTFENVTRLDINPMHSPDVLWDLIVHPLPFQDEEFDEIHAYEVLEHLGSQGDSDFFFAEFTEYARILKPNGVLFASVPDVHSPWAWGDPGHRRIINHETLIFLDQTYYWQVGATSMTDYRNIYKADLRLIFEQVANGKFYFALQKN